VGEAIFDPAYWRHLGRLAPADRGRGCAWFVGDGSRDWVLRHYRRGGFAAKLAADRYVWTGEARVRAFAEWRLLDSLWRRGLPVAQPIAARFRRDRLFYRCDLLTRRVPQARPLSALLGGAAAPDPPWGAIGAAVAALHHAGVDHADLNAHNVLIDARGKICFIDFDRGRLRAHGRWTMRNLRRLHRSVIKLGAAGSGADLGSAWNVLMNAYRAAAGEMPPPAA